LQCKAYGLAAIDVNASTAAPATERHVARSSTQPLGAYSAAAESVLLAAAAGARVVAARLGALFLERLVHRRARQPGLRHSRGDSRRPRSQRPDLVRPRPTSRHPNQATIRDIEQGKDVKLSNLRAVANALGLQLELVPAAV